ncbi:MAG: OmpA family protein [Methylotenera sp.]|jgi:outer membrane protein OmpA-like peptidoglycan-associated protein|nr:OmpA family protein [Methylotenera sp.]
MKITPVLLMAALILSAGCAPKTLQLSLDESPKRVSRDYEAIGDASGIRPYVYGKSTLIKLDKNAPTSLSIKDEAGVTVNYRYQAGYYILDRQLEQFTLSGSGRLVQFNRIQPAPRENPQESITESDDENFVLMQDERSLVQPTKKIAANDPIYSVMKEQLLVQRKLLAIASDNPRYTGKELFKLNERLDMIEYSITQGNRAIVHVYFPFNNTVFNPERPLLDALLPLAKIASRINLYGRTDSKVSDDGNKIIAHGRADAAKDFLVKQGVSSDVIRASSVASADFIAPADMEESRTLNRRVTIEIIL